MRKTTKPIGKGTRNLTTNIPNDLYGDLQRMARVSGCKIGEYARAVLTDAAVQKIMVRDNQDDVAAYDAALASGGSLPKIRKEVARTGDKIFSLTEDVPRKKQSR